MRSKPGRQRAADRKPMRGKPVDQGRQTGQIPVTVQQRRAAEFPAASAAEPGIGADGK